MGHTPGPFRIIPAPHMGEHPNHEFRFIGTADFDEETNHGQVLAKLTDSPEIVGNAHLFQAAPDLLAALKGLIAVTTKPLPLPGEMDAAYAAARAAIARAEGTK